MRYIILSVISVFIPVMLSAQNTGQVISQSEELLHEFDQDIKLDSAVSGMIAFGEFSQAHPDKFFSTLNGNNVIDVPQLYISEQNFLGNSLRLGKKSRFYFVSGIMYGAQLGVRGNNWGMGTKEGILWRPTETIAVVIWNQYFQSVSVYTPILFHEADGDTSAVLMPATPEVFSFGVQASFTVGEFLIGVGASVAPVSFQKRHHSKFRYK